MFNPGLDLSFLLGDLGVLASFNGASTKGLIDIVSVEVLDGQQANVVVNKKTLIIKTGSLPGLKEQNSITIDSKPYRVQKMMLEEDGDICRLFLV